MHRESGFEELINAIENKIAEVVDIEPIEDNQDNVSENSTNLFTLDQEHTLVLEFLKSWSKYAFNIPRIRNWGATKGGFPELSKLSRRHIEDILTDLEEQGYIYSYTSKKGSMMYKYDA